MEKAIAEGRFGIGKNSPSLRMLSSSKSSGTWTEHSAERIAGGRSYITLVSLSSVDAANHTLLFVLSHGSGVSRQADLGGGEPQAIRIASPRTFQHSSAQPDA